MNHWINKSVKINDSWGPGAAHTLVTPLGQPAEFTLRPLYVRDAGGTPQLAHFWIDFPSGYLADGWQGVNFIPMGSTPPAGITGLPQWDPKHRDAYRKAIASAAGNLGDSKTARLEGVVPYVDQSGVGYNKVRLYYAFNAVQGTCVDLVVVKITTHVACPGTVQGKQDGEGHGPPG